MRSWIFFNVAKIVYRFGEETSTVLVQNGKFIWRKLHVVYESDEFNGIPDGC